MKCNTSRVEYNQAEQQHFMLGEFVFDVKGLYAYLEELNEGRDPRRVRYRLADVLSLIILAKLGGEDEPRGIADWLKHRDEVLVPALKLPRSSMPHAMTISRILGQAVEPKQLEQVLHRYFDGQAQLSQEVVIAIDGKTMRGTIAPGERQGLHLLAAYLPGEGLVLMQVEVDSQENEIVAAPNCCVNLTSKGVLSVAMPCLPNGKSRLKF